MMGIFHKFPRLTSLVLVVTITLFAISSLAKPDESKYCFSTATCRQISNKFAIISPWTTYPILYEPIKRGRLTVWSGLSSLPMSEFRCHPDHDNTSVVVMDFSSFANKLEWTFQDMKTSASHHGISVVQYENMRFKVNIRNNQASSYLECNTIDHIDSLSSNETSITLGSTCLDCSSSLIALVDAQIKEITRSEMLENTKENLRWHLTQILTNQHVTNPVAFYQ